MPSNLFSTRHVGRFVCVKIFPIISLSYLDKIINYFTHCIPRLSFKLVENSETERVIICYRVRDALTKYYEYVSTSTFM